MTNTESMAVGTIIFYTGDMANRSGYGRIEAVRPADRFAPLSYDITLDDGRKLRAIWALSFQPGPGRRFMTAAEQKAQHQEALARMKAQIAKMTGKVAL